MFWKGLYQCWAAGKNLRLAKLYYNYYINLFRHVFNVSVCSAQPQIFVIECIFDIMQFDKSLQKLFHSNYHGSTSLPTRIIEPSTHQAFTCSKAVIETLEQGVKSV